MVNMKLERIFVE